MRDSLGSTSDFVLRSYAPSVIARPYLAAFSGVGSPEVQLGQRLALVETVLRFLVAVQAAECAGLGMDAPKVYHELVARLDRPTMGLWAQVAREFARALVRRDDLVVPKLPAMLAAVRGRKVTDTPAMSAVFALIKVRNKLVHDSGSVIPSGARARQALQRIDAHQRTLLAALRQLRDYPVMVVEDVHRRVGTDTTAKLIRFRGTEPRVLLEPLANTQLPEGHPFVLGARGDTLLLSPFLGFGAFDGESVELRLLQRWQDGPVYAAPVGGSTAPWPGREDDAEDPAAFIEFYRRQARFGGVFAPPQVSRLAETGYVGGLPQVAGYRLIERLGAGASGAVYVAEPEDAGGQARVAIKLLKPELATDPVQRDLLRREFDLMAAFSSPFVVRVFRFGEDAAVGPFMAMELVRGQNLDRAVVAAPMPATRAVRVCCDVLDGLAGLHARGLVHRDIKPGNVVLAEDGAPKLLDFGLAVGDRPQIDVLAPMNAGTTAFAAPEQLQGQVVDPRADLFSVGRLLGFLVCGSRSPEAQLLALPPGLRAVYRRATHAQRDQRYADAAALQSALQDGLSSDVRGAPLAVGDMVGGQLRLDALDGVIGDDTWVFRAWNVDLEEAAGVLITLERERKLADLFRGRPRHLVGTVGHPLRTPGGLAWCLLPGDRPLETAQALFVAARPASEPLPVVVQDEPVDAAVVIEEDPVDWADIGVAPSTLSHGWFRKDRLSLMRRRLRGVRPPSFLRGYPQPQAVGDPVRLAVMAHQLALAIHAISPTPLDESAWLDMQGELMRPVLSLLDPVAWPPPAPVGAALLRLDPVPYLARGFQLLHRAALQPQSAQLSLDELQDARRSVEGLALVLIDVCRGGGCRDLAPFMVRGPKGHWGMLSREGGQPKRVPFFPR